MFYLTNYNTNALGKDILKKINGPFDKKVLNFTFIKNELTLRVTR